VFSIGLCHPGQVLSGWNTLHFPRLESLRLQIYTPGFFDGLVRNWHVPNIQILSIESDRTTPWVEFIEKWGKELQTLELILRFSSWSRVIQLPALKELLVAGRSCAPYKIIAPKLELFGVFLIHASARTVREDVITIVDHARRSFPTLKRLRLRGFEGDPYHHVPFIAPIEPPCHGLTADDLDEWKQAGIEVDVRSS
jgi:hypothetical protein